jgi:hypothetical protein
MRPYIRTEGYELVSPWAAPRRRGLRNALRFAWHVILAYCS